MRAVAVRGILKQGTTCGRRRSCSVRSVRFGGRVAPELPSAGIHGCALANAVVSTIHTDSVGEDMLLPPEQDQAPRNGTSRG